MKAGGAIIVGLVLCAAVGTVIMNPDGPGASANPTAHDPEQPAVSPLVKWHSNFDGVKVACFRSGSSRGFVTMPTNEQVQNGMQVIENSNPSDDAWDEACGGRQ